jgi:hypothetical protein
MSLVAAGLVNVDGDIEDVVRAVTCAAEAGVGAGGTITDGGLSRYIAETGQSAASGERIDMGAIAFAAARTVAVRFVQRAVTGGVDDYHSIASRGSVFENASEFAIGWRQATIAPFQYQRNVATLRGSEASGQPQLTAGTAYTVIYRAEANSKQLYFCAQDIGGAGVDYVLVTSSTDAIGTDGGQHVFLGGPNTFTSQDRSINSGILGVLIYDHRIDDTELAAIALDGATGFYAQIPTAAGPTIDTQPQSQSKIVGETATFTVAATTSGGTLSYQWKRNGSNVGTDANSYTTPTLVIGDDGDTVTVDVTDSNGTTVSNTATLTVGTGPVITQPDPTDGSGEATATVTSDVPLSAAGEMLLVTFTRGAVTLRTTCWPETP